MYYGFIPRNDLHTKFLVPARCHDTSASAGVKSSPQLLSSAIGGEDDGLDDAKAFLFVVLEILRPRHDFSSSAVRSNLT